jgi:3-hydroxymyristoyl/3-hydroxydecanoyl-(acyl carrier protein) dehydratase/1-acyl-sn-glycerol-3-phosphate acyltransferase
VHASGRISALFGPALAAQDAHALQVRMPEPPLLLADRVTGLVGEVASMGKGTVWTETDVTADAWYLENGRMPAGLMIESGQADLFLISYLGADLFNRGERRYRLLGCQLTWHRSPPKVGETLCYDIHVDGHAQMGAQRLFFFHYDCHIGGAPALTVRGGQAGFFTQEELDESAGVLWSPEEQEITPDARVDPPAVQCTKRALDSSELEALRRGDVVGCFGPGYEATRSHVRTPRIAGGRMRWLERVTDLDPHGGPWKRGYLKAVTTIRPDDWYFSGHFKNDPCMPGTLMFEGCLSAMSLYLIGLGYSLDRDGFRFEPIPDETYTMICRGQVIPTSKELTYELFVEEVHDGPVPKLYADLLCTVDGLKAFHARRMGLQLVPDWPLTSEPAPLPDPEPVATLDGLPLGRAALLASAWGPPSQAFGPRYSEFDGLRRAPRLPGPPYHFVSRVVRVDGEPWTKKAGASVEIAYDVPPDAWYFADGASRAQSSAAMPYAVLLEAALQPCGWLATYVGSTLGRREDLRFRNLDGEGEVLGEVHPDSRTLVTRATLTTLSDTAGMIIVGFDVVTRDSQRDIYRLRTQFGFFPDAAFRNQAGLPVRDEHRALFEPTNVGIALERHAARLPQGRLALLDAIPYFDARGGRAGLGAARAEASVDPGAWFFKAHFFQDPVQPGSLGMEAMLTLLRAVMLELGLAGPDTRFEPIAAGVPHRWKYRGQVLPTDGRIAITLELTRIDREGDRIVAHADASFWVDGKRIYEATIAGALTAPESELTSTSVPEPAPESAVVHVHGFGAEPAPESAPEPASEPVPAPWPIQGQLDLGPIAHFWREWLGVGPSMAEDLYLAALRRFVGRVHADPALAAITHRPALFLANHQTAIETLMLSIVAGACTGVPVITLAKREHRESWLGRFLAWIFAQPGVRERELTAYFDRDDPASLPGLLRALPRDRGLLIHAEGTRATRANAPLGPISGVPLDLALERELPIVPVRFTGGLPLEPVVRKLDFPVGMGAQDLHLGAPIEPDVLRALPYKARLEHVRTAIEALGPREERPSAPDLAFAADVARRMEQRSLDLPHAVLASLLFEHSSPSALTAQVRAGEPLEPAHPEHAWALDLLARLGL